MSQAPEAMESEPQWFYAKRVYASVGGIDMEFYSEADARAALLESKRQGATRNWRVERTVTMPFSRTQPPTIVEGVEFQSDL